PRRRSGRPTGRCAAAELAWTSGSECRDPGSERRSAPRLGSGVAVVGLACRCRTDATRTARDGLPRFAWECVLDGCDFAAATSADRRMAHREVSLIELPPERLRSVASG